MYPVNLFSLAFQAARLSALAVEAQSVITMRLLGMAGMWNWPRGEALRMVSEKQKALTEASSAVTAAMMRGTAPGPLLQAAITPFERHVRRNRKRLSRHGARKRPATSGRRQR